MAELEGRGGAAWYRAAYRYGPDVISDSIFSVCREQYDQLVMGSLTDLTLPGGAEVEAADALYTLWNTWLARAEQRLPPGSRWGITDYSLDGTGLLAGMRMPVRYVVEMFLDRIAASKVYKGSRYRDSDPLEYYMNGKAGELMHPETRKLLEKLLHMLAEQGEETTYQYIRREVLKKRR